MILNYFHSPIKVGGARIYCLKRNVDFELIINREKKTMIYDRSYNKMYLEKEEIQEMCEIIMNNISEA